MTTGKVAAGVFCLLAALTVGPAPAQIAPRLTGERIVAGLETARQELAVRAAGLPHSSLAATSERMAALAEALRKTLGGDAAKPIDLVGADARASAYRAQSVVERAQAYLDASKGCLDADASVMAEVLGKTVELAMAGGGASKQQPVIHGVETLDHRPLFVLRGNAQGAAFALDGANLFDAQCEDPVVTATDGQGKRQAVQPTVTGVLPNRIELKLPDNSSLPSGNYVLHVASRRKAFLVGCAAQPEVTAVVQVAAAPKMSVSYALTPTCQSRDGAHALAPIAGVMPDLAGNGAVSQAIVIEGCDNPVSYAVTANVTFDDGRTASIGPFSQIASAGITAGLPGGLTMSWDPSVRQLFVRPVANTCKGVY